MSGCNFQEEESRKKIGKLTGQFDRFSPPRKWEGTFYTETSLKMRDKWILGGKSTRNPLKCDE